MKAWMLTGVLAIVLVLAMILEEFRIGKLTDRIGDLEKQLAVVDVSTGISGGGRKLGGSAPAAERTVRGPRAEVRSERVAREERPGGEDSGNVGDSLRKMAENPAGRAMMNQGVKAMSAMWFADLVDRFDLSREEEDYFLSIVAGSMSQQQAVGMKMMGAKNAAEREALLEEMERVKEDAKTAVKDFLNDDKDFEAYEGYEARLPERQQLDGLRAVMASAEVPLSAEQEESVMDAMYTVRTSAASEATDWNGPGGMEAIASGEAAARFEEEWERTSAATAAEVGKVLDASQLEAFVDYQKQVKEMQMMGIEMAEKMFAEPSGPEGGE